MIEIDMNEKLTRIIVFMMAGIGLLVALIIVRLYDPPTNLDVTCEVECRCNNSIVCPTEPTKSIDITCEPTYFGTADLLNQKNIKAAHSDFDWEKIVETVDDYGELYGSSMEPTFFDGNTAISIFLTDDYELKPGEIVRYRLKPFPGCEFNVDNMDTQIGEVAIHRINAIYSDNEILIVPDNTNSADMIRRCQITHVIVGVLFT